MISVPIVKMAGKSLDELEGFWLAVAMGWPIVVPMSLALLVLVPIGAIVGALPAVLLAGCCCACDDFWELGPHHHPKHPKPAATDALKPGSRAQTTSRSCCCAPGR